MMGVSREARWDGHSGMDKGASVQLQLMYMFMARQCGPAFP